ncbi:MAG: NAD(+)/NADH kinase [Chthoniobacterales bacterium]
MIGIVAHIQKPEAPALVTLFVSKLEARKIPYLLEKNTASIIGKESNYSEIELAAQCELLVVIGGDGTLLRVVHRIDGKFCPVFGINIGGLGFLTSVGSHDIEKAIESIAAKNYVLTPRSILQVRVESEGTEPAEFLGVNDVVVSRGERSQLVVMEVRIDGVPLTTYNADGLIVATPTGSTAYSLAAGGPILLPDSGAFVITPICPHVLTNRSTVVSDDSVIEVQMMKRRQEVFVSVDGRNSHSFQGGDVLKIHKSKFALQLAMLPDVTFSEVLRQKLKWSGSNL